MGGSSAPPGDLWRKFFRRRRTELDAQRLIRLLRIREHATHLVRCCAWYDHDPAFWKDEMVRSLEAIGRLCRNAPHGWEEPDIERRLDLEDTFINAITPIQYWMGRSGNEPLAFELMQSLRQKSLSAYRRELRRQEGLDVAAYQPRGERWKKAR